MPVKCGVLGPCSDGKSEEEMETNQMLLYDTERKVAGSDVDCLLGIAGGFCGVHT